MYAKATSAMQQPVSTLFGGQQYVNVVTFRKTGQQVATPMWFVEDEEVLFVRTFSNMAKVKRLRNNPCVFVAACTAAGELRGPWYEGTAMFLEGDQARRANAALSRKYGWTKRFADLWYSLRNGDQIVIAIRIKGGASTLNG